LSKRGEIGKKEGSGRVDANGKGSRGKGKWERGNARMKRANDAAGTSGVMAAMQKKKDSRKGRKDNQRFALKEVSQILLKREDDQGSKPTPTVYTTIGKTGEKVKKAKWVL